jgi:hypothetical protein
VGELPARHPVQPALFLILILRSAVRPADAPTAGPVPGAGLSTQGILPASAPPRTPGAENY